MDKFQEGKEPLFQRTKEFFDLNYQECKGPVFQNSLPWKNRRIKIDLSLTKSIDKIEDRVSCNPEDALPRAHRQIPGPHLHVHGRVQVRRQSCSSSRHPGRRLQKNPETGGLVQCRPYIKTHLTAIWDAIDWIYTNRTFERDIFAIFTDSLSAAESVKAQKSASSVSVISDSIDRLGPANITVV